MGVQTGKLEFIRKVLKLPTQIKKICFLQFKKKMFKFIIQKLRLCCHRNFTQADLYICLGGVGGLKKLWKSTFVYSSVELGMGLKGKKKLLKL